MMTFEGWLRTVCFQAPTPEAHDLAKCAWDAALESVRSEALSRRVDVHRGWCNYCKGNVEWCDNSPKGGCTLRDYLHSPARVADGLPDRPVGWTDVEEALITTPESPAKEQPGEQN